MVLQTKLKSSLTLIVTCLGFCGASLSAAEKTGHEPILENPGFEVGLDNWTSEGGRLRQGEAVFSADPLIRRSGRRAAKIENLSRNAAVLKQKVRVEADTVYKVSGWIKTENVSGAGGSCGANLSVNQQAYSTDVKGTSDWRLLELWVRTGKEQSRLGVQCRLGYSSGAVTGIAWFDDLAVEKAAAPPPGITIQQLHPKRTPQEGSTSGYWLVLLILTGALVFQGRVLRRYPENFN